MRKKLTAVLPAAAMFAYALAGTTGIAQNVYAADEEETLTVWCWDPTFNVYAMKQAEAAYQKDHPNFKLDIQEKVYSDIEQSLITAAEAGTYDTLPDIFLMQDYSFHKNVTNYPEIFTELTDSGIDFSKFSAGKLADSTVDEKNYGVPFDNGATIMAIRSDMVEKAGLKVEDFMDTTWSEFIELAKKVVEANDVPMLTSSGGSEIVIEMLQSAGASPIVDGEVKLVDNEALKAAIEVYKQLIDEGIMVDYTDWDQYIASMNKGTAAGRRNEEKSRRIFHTGISAVSITGRVPTYTHRRGRTQTSGIYHCETDGSSSGGAGVHRAEEGKRIPDDLPCGR